MYVNCRVLSNSGSGPLNQYKRIHSVMFQEDCPHLQLVEIIDCITILAATEVFITLWLLYRNANDRENLFSSLQSRVQM